jgi:mannose-6-phosphate isomerase-like protein (cupin superfamily)
MGKRLLLFSLLLAGTSSLIAQTPAATAPAPPAQAPATPATGKVPAATPTTKGTGTAPATGKGAAPAATGTRGTTTTTSRNAASAARSGIALTVTYMGGATIPGVQVEVTGPTERRENTDAGGQVNFPQLQAGTYRLRFTGDKVTSFEKEVTLTSGKVSMLDISLSPAPAPREVVREVRAPAPAAPAAAAIGPIGMPQLTSLYDIAQSQLKSNQPRAETLVACSGNLRSTVVIVAKDQPRRLYDSAEASYYVLGGEATFTVGGEEKTLEAGGYTAIPRGVPFSIERHGKKQLALLALLSGAPCEEAK